MIQGLPGKGYTELSLSVLVRISESQFTEPYLGKSGIEKERNSMKEEK